MFEWLDASSCVYLDMFVNLGNVADRVVIHPPESSTLTGRMH